MSVISMQDGKNIENKELEVHVVLCEYRRKATEEKVEALEKTVKEITQNTLLTKRLIVSAALSVITGVITTVVSILLNFNFLKS